MPNLSESGSETRPTVMRIGLGDLRCIPLELLAHEDRLGRLVVASRNFERGLARCNLARFSAIAQGHAPSISFVPMDLSPIL